MGVNEEEKNVSREGYKHLGLDSEKIKEISVTPVVKDGQLLFGKDNENHRYIVDG